MKNTGLVFGAAPIVSPPGSAAPPSILKDQSRYKNDGTFTNVTWSQLPSGLWVMNFNGATSKVTITNSDSNRKLTTKLSVVIWALISAAGRQVFLYKAQGALIQYGLEVSTGWRSELPASWTTAGAVSSLGRWRFFCGTFDSSLGSDNAKIFVNATQTGQATSAVALTSTTYNITLGEWAGFYLTGSLALPRIFNYALSADQISRIYEAERRWFV
jgi:hypothetical protein